MQISSYPSGLGSRGEGKSSGSQPPCRIIEPEAENDCNDQRNEEEIDAYAGSLHV